MAYMNQEKKQVIKQALDKVLKPLGFKFSLKVYHSSKISLTIRSGPIDFINDHLEYIKTEKPWDFNDDMAKYMKDRNYMSINQYWYNENYTKKTAELIGKIVQAMKSADWFDKSDAMVDYFHTAYYYDINVGQWDKPYQVTK